MSDSMFIDRLVERLDRLDPGSVQGYIQKLARTKGLLETVLQTIGEGVLIIDRDLRLQYVNNAAIELLGLPKDEQQRDGQTIDRYLRDLDWDRLMAQSTDDWAHAARREVEVSYPQHRVLEFYLLPWHGQQEDADASDGNVIIILHDISDLRKQTETELETEKLNAITMLAAGVAHEIGNPLNSLTIHLQLLERFFKEAKLDPEIAKEPLELLEVASGEVHRLDTIINQFLKAIRPSSPDLQPLSLSELLTETMKFMSQEIEDRGILVEAEWLGDIPDIIGDADQLKQAFYNLIKNAVQAMPNGGSLRIGLTHSDEAIELSFADTGTGIAAADLSNIFDPYYTTRDDGTGLGLVIIGRILREHGAKLAVDSSPGDGTVFTITFPLRERRTRRLKAPDDDGVQGDK